MRRLRECTRQERERFNSLARQVGGTLAILIHLESVLDVLRLFPMLQPRLDEADPLGSIVGGDIQNASTTHGCRCRILEVPNLEDHPHVRLYVSGSSAR